MTISFNERAAIAAEVENLKKDPDIPVWVDGEVLGTDDYEAMDSGEAARIVVDAVIDHPYLAKRLDEADLYWKALKWLAAHRSDNELPPPDLWAVMESVYAAALIEES